MSSTIAAGRSRDPTPHARETARLVHSSTSRWVRIPSKERRRNCAVNFAGIAKTEAMIMSAVARPPATRKRGSGIDGSLTLVELDQVLEDQVTPALAVRLHKQSPFR
jgi:hypothetical protein